jgi:hypothetical protein
MIDQVEIRWIKAGIVGGLCASALYPSLLFAPLSMRATAALAAFLGPAIGIGSLGLYQLMRLHARSVSAALGAIHNVIAGGLFTAMALVQLAVKSHTPASTEEIIGVWLGLDVAWDMYIGLGTIFFAGAMLSHPRFRWPFAVSGLTLGLLVIVLNLLPFPMPPADVGSIDVGPFVGLWYLAATIQAWRSLTWARHQLGVAAGD